MAMREPLPRLGQLLAFLPLGPALGVLEGMMMLCRIGARFALTLSFHGLNFCA